MSNPNLLYAARFVQGLAESGLTHVCIAPGSRSTPLTLAFDAHPEIEVSLHLDERCAAFYALGIALATDAPVAMLCTSGSAAANFFPALIEAMMSQVPLLVLTADRPHELRHSGANQTIDQVKLYGDNVLWSVDAPLPVANAPDVALRNMQTLAARAYATANGIRKGPVHVNFPFRKPLEPVDNKQYAAFSKQLLANSDKLKLIREAPDGKGNASIPAHASQVAVYNSISHGILHPTDAQASRLQQIITQFPNGIIVCGPRCPGGAFPEAVAALSRRIGYPIFADPTSGVRYGRFTQTTPILSAYETTFQRSTHLPDPDVVLRFGAVPISKWLNAYLDGISPQHRVHVRSSGVWADDSHRTDWLLQADEVAVCERIEGAARLGDWVDALVTQDAAVREAVESGLQDANFDGAYVADVLAALPDDALLFVGNSLPIRHLDQYGFARESPVHAYASRGASGIDGNISTALGMQHGSGKKLVLIVGDVTFYHDMNALLAVKQRVDAKRPLDLTIVLINNNGGGIFNRLPVAQFDPPFTPLFLTPHGLDFEPVVGMYGLDFIRVRARDAFQTAFQNSLSDATPRVIEVITDDKNDERSRKEINGLAQTARRRHAA